MITGQYLREHFADVVWFTINPNWTSEEFNEKIGFPANNNSLQQIISKDGLTPIPNMPTLLATDQTAFENWNRNKFIPYQYKLIIAMLLQSNPGWTQQQAVDFIIANK